MIATFRRTLTVLRNRVMAGSRREPNARAVQAATGPATLTVDDLADQAWLAAHRDDANVAGVDTTVVHADADVQQWMAATLRDMGWQVSEPAMFTVGWVPARANVGSQPDGQPFVSVTTPSKSKAFSRSNDPSTSKKAGAAAAARQAITVTSHQGMLLAAFATQHASKPGHGLTAAEAVVAAGLGTDGATGSPWHRVTDLRDMGLITPLLDHTAGRTRRRNESKSEADVMVLTALGVRAAAALARLNAAGYLDEPLVFDGYTAPTLFGQHAQDLAIVDAA